MNMKQGVPNQNHGRMKINNQNKFGSDSLYKRNGMSLFGSSILHHCAKTSLSLCESFIDTSNHETVTVVFTAQVAQENQVLQDW
jgi:hypothetical protein